jgi:hypothetical protein
MGVRSLLFFIPSLTVPPYKISPKSMRPVWRCDNVASCRRFPHNIYTGRLKGTSAGCHEGTIIYDSSNFTTKQTEEFEILFKVNYSVIFKLISPFCNINLAT